jgi:hypothetical protein
VVDAIEKLGHVLLARKHSAGSAAKRIDNQFMSCLIEQYDQEYIWILATNGAGQTKAASRLRIDIGRYHYEIHLRSR